MYPNRRLVSQPLFLHENRPRQQEMNISITM
jgi:hypothetical protein